MPTNSKLKREKRIAFAKKYAARIVNFKNSMANLARKMAGANRMSETDVRQRFIAGMTNWQRHQWNKAVRVNKMIEMDTETVVNVNSVQVVQYYANADRKTREVRMEGMVVGHV